jgi:hypothetical protein
MSEATNLDSLVAHIIEVAKEAARAESRTVLDAMVILHVRLAHDLIDKGVFTPDEYALSMATVVKEAEKCRQANPALFSAIEKSATALAATFGRPRSVDLPDLQNFLPRPFGKRQ